MKKSISYPVPPSLSKDASINQVRYEAMYQESLEHPERFWGQQGKKFLSWITPWRRLTSTSLIRENRMVPRRKAQRMFQLR